VTPPRRPTVSTVSSPGEALAWVAALVFTLSSFMAWYTADQPYITVSVIGWHTGTIGKLTFFVGVLVIGFLFLRATGVELPPGVPAGMLIAGVGTAGTILVMIRVIDVPDRLVGFGRAIGIWIALASALALVVAGLLRAGEESLAP
jgi:hypothetical protein